MKSVTLLALFLFLATGCTTVRKFGDARIYDRKNYPFSISDDFTLPKVKLDRVGEYTFQVRNLPFAIYPQEFRLHVPETEALEVDHGGHGQPWRNCVINIEFRSASGETFFARRIDMDKPPEDLRVLTGLVEKGLVIFDLFPYHPGRLYSDESPPTESKIHPPSLPQFTSYDVLISVLRPSLRAMDTAQLFAYTHYYKPPKNN